MMSTTCKRERVTLLSGHYHSTRLGNHPLTQNHVITEIICRNSHCIRHNHVIMPYPPSRNLPCRTPPFLPLLAIISPSTRRVINLSHSLLRFPLNLFFNDRPSVYQLILLYTHPPPSPSPSGSDNHIPTCLYNEHPPTLPPDHHPPTTMSSTYLPSTSALSTLSEYPSGDGLSLKELMDTRRNGQGGLTYNDFLVLPGKIDFPVSRVCWRGGGCCLFSLPFVLSIPFLSFLFSLLSLFISSFFSFFFLLLLPSSPSSSSSISYSSLHFSRLDSRFSILDYRFSIIDSILDSILDTILLDPSVSPWSICFSCDCARTIK